MERENEAKFKGIKMEEKGNERQNMDTLYESGEPKKTNAGRRKMMMITRKQNGKWRTK